MRVRTMIASLAGVAAVAGGAPGLAPAQTAGVLDALTCVAPTDAGAIDAVLAHAGSPLAGQGTAFVTQGVAAGLDPRALVAIAAHETILETYAPAAAIHNPFGLGPGMTFASEADAIAFAAKTLAGSYLPEGRTTLAAIGAKWAPIGALNDPTGLNANWTRGVSTFYAALGGDAARPVMLASQSTGAACAPGAPAPGGTAPASGPPVVTAWGGLRPTVTARSLAGGADPASGEPVVLTGFVFPLALPVGAPAVFGDTFSEPGTGPGGVRASATIASSPGASAVAAIGGTLHEASAAEREEGIAFWITMPGGDRVGYGPLLRYAPGIGEGASVAPGALIGEAPTSLRIAWEHGGARVNPFPLLQTTRPSA